MKWIPWYVTKGGQPKDSREHGMLHGCLQVMVYTKNCNEVVVFNTCHILMHDGEF
jgi:hypothetical protein